MECSFCGKDVEQDKGHYDAIDEDKIMCIDCYKKIVIRKMDGNPHAQCY